MKKKEYQEKILEKDKKRAKVLKQRIIDRYNWRKEQGYINKMLNDTDDRGKKLVELMQVVLNSKKVYEIINTYQKIEELEREYID